MNVRILLSLSFVLLAGCVPEVIRTGSHPEVATKLGQIEKTASFEPSFTLMTLDASSASEKQPEWTAEAVSSIKKVLNEKSEATAEFPVSFFELPEELETEFEEVAALNDAIMLSALFHSFTPGPAQFEHKKNEFVYSVGSLDEFLTQYEADSLLVVSGYAEYSTGGRKGLMALGVIAGAVTGVAIIPRGGFNYMSASLYDSEGDLVWMAYRTGTYTYREEEGIREVLKDIFEDFPGADNSSRTE